MVAARALLICCLLLLTCCGAPDSPVDLLRDVAGGDPATRRSALEELREHFPFEAQQLDADAAQGALKVRESAVVLLSIVKDPDVVDALVSLVDADEPVVRRAALAMLGFRARWDPGPIENHIPTLAERLDDPDFTVREGASFVLGELGRPALGRLLWTFEHGSARARPWAVRGLVYPDDLPAGVLSRLKPARTDADPFVRLAAAWVFARNGVEQEFVDSILRSSLGSGRALDREWGAYIALSCADRAHHHHEALEGLLFDEVDATRIVAAEALERMGEGSERTEKILDPVRAQSEHPLHDTIRGPD